VDVLDRGDQTGNLSFELRQCLIQYSNIKIDFPWQKDDTVLRIDRGMPDMDKNIGMVKGIEREVTGSVTGITAYDHFKACIFERSGELRSPAFQPGRELEGNGFGSPLIQLSDQVRCSA
jgi:hypothetical protein